MLSLGQLSAALLVLGSQAFAAVVPNHERDLDRRQDTTASTVASSTSTGTATSTTSTRTPDPSCTNSASDRSCWDDEYSIDDDFDLKWPTTGKTNYYTLTITNTTACPNGACREMMLINDQFPGPTISGNWGDDFEITVVNNMENNGTSIHWHGLRQFNNTQNDGANGISGCPIPPGSSSVYTFKATQYGTSWYHSHHSAQYADGILGPIVIDGPATYPYEEDLGPLVLTDTYNVSEGGAFALNWQAQHSTGAPPTPDSILVNGAMVNATGGGSYYKTSVTQGSTYRMRIINSAVDTFFYFQIDGHSFHVITADFVPITPIETDYLVIALGQRYDIVFTADQDVDNYWIRTTPAADCLSSSTMLTYQPEIVMGSILSYDGADDSDPTSTATVTPSGCDDQTGVSPWWKTTVDITDFETDLGNLDVTLDQADLTSLANTSIVSWQVNESSMNISWDDPTLQYVLDGNTDYPTAYNIYTMPKIDQWYFWVINNDPDTALAHPIHLHGHDFFVLGNGTGTWDGDTSGLTTDNPMRRDVAILPASGYLIIAFPTDNPGAWLMHCHIAWHVSDGLSVQFLERVDEIVDSIGSTSEMTSNCAAWSTYWDGDHPYDKEDSGL